MLLRVELGKNLEQSFYVPMCEVSPDPLKVARYPVFSRSTNLESKLIVFFVLLKFLAHSPFWESQTVHGP